MQSSVGWFRCEEKQFAPPIQNASGIEVRELGRMSCRITIHDSLILLWSLYLQNERSESHGQFALNRNRPSGEGLTRLSQYNILTTQVNPNKFRAHKYLSRGSTLYECPAIQLQSPLTGKHNVFECNYKTNHYIQLPGEAAAADIQPGFIYKPCIKLACSSSQFDIQR